jgi:hypothetical protein
VAINAGLTAELAILSQALDDSEDSIARSVLRLAAEISAAVQSYLGLTVTIMPSASQISFTMLQDGGQPAGVRSSVRIALPSADPGEGDVGPAIALTFYAATPGAFVDLAADLAWLNRGNPTQITLDQHLTVAAGVPTATPSAVSLINQAIGMLIGRGHSPEQARQRLSRPSASGVVDHLDAAVAVLADLGPHREPDLSG